MEQVKVLVVDDEKNILESVKMVLNYEKYGVQVARDGMEAIEAFKSLLPDIVLLDVKMPGLDGLKVLQTFKTLNPTAEVIMISGHSGIEEAVEASRLGAFDFLEKPISRDKLVLTVRNAAEKISLLKENYTLRRQTEKKYELVGESPVMKALQETIRRLARSDSTVLISGDSGTGKELIARMIHQQSARSQNRFVQVNCAAIPDELIESELFGHEKGAFTGADRRRLGRFEEAAGGTLFLDEIGEIPASLQVKLLRVLQEKTIQRLGSNENIPVDFRLIAATNRDLPELARRGEFRSDLFYRLNVIRLEIPPLRRRKEDIPGLIDHFIHTFAAANARPVDGVSPEAMHLLMRHDFPGNVRELENMVERAVVLARTSRLQPEDFPELTGAGGASLTDELFHLPLPQAVAALERHRISEALEAAGHVQIRAAEALGMTERNLRYKMEKYGIAARRK